MKIKDIEVNNNYYYQFYDLTDDERNFLLKHFKFQKNVLNQNKQDNSLYVLAQFLPDLINKLAKERVVGLGHEFDASLADSLLKTIEHFNQNLVLRYSHFKGHHFLITAKPVAYDNFLKGSLRLPYCYKFSDLSSVEYNLLDRVGNFDFYDINNQLKFKHQNVLYLPIGKLPDLLDAFYQKYIKNGSNQSYQDIAQNMYDQIKHFQKQFEAKYQEMKTQKVKKHAYLNTIWMALVTTVFIGWSGVYLPRYFELMSSNAWFILFLTILVSGLILHINADKKTHHPFSLSLFFLMWGFAFTGLSVLMLFLRNPHQLFLSNTENLICAAVTLILNILMMFVLMQLFAWHRRSLLIDIWSIVGSGINVFLFHKFRGPEFEIDAKSKQLKKLN